MNIILSEISIQEKGQLTTMLLDYFKEIDDSKVVKSGEGEAINYPYLESYWTDTSRIPMKIMYQGIPIGFVLLNNWIVCKEFNAQMAIAEFYIKPALRRKGIGRNVAFQLFSKFRGKWEIRHDPTNLKASHFWRATIEAYTMGNFKEINNNAHERIYLFEN